MNDVPNTVGESILYPYATPVPTFADRRKDLRDVFLQFGRIDDAHGALYAGYMSGTWRGDVTCGVVAPASGAYGIDEKGASSREMEREAYFEDEWVGLGFGTGGEERVLKVLEWCWKLMAWATGWTAHSPAQLRTYGPRETPIFRITSYITSVRLH